MDDLYTPIIIAGFVLLAVAGVLCWWLGAKWAAKRPAITYPRLHQMLDLAPIGACILTIEKILYVNPEMLKTIGCRQGDTLLRFCRDPEELRTLLKELFEHRRTVTSRMLTFRYQAGDYYRFVIEARECEYEGQQAAIFWLMEIETAVMAQGMIYQARHDALTDCVNRHGFEEQLKSEMERVARISNHTFSLIMLDIDMFKKINDTHGHLCGDSILVEISQLFRTNVRAYDVVCRWGGEEFFIMLPSAGGADAARLAERLRARIDAHIFTWQDKQLHLTASAGVQEYVRGQSAEELISAVDKKLYFAKNNGRNQVAG